MKYPKETFVRWKGIKNSDTGEIDMGYLYFRTGIDRLTGVCIRNVGGRKEAMEKYYQDNN